MKLFTTCKETSALLSQALDRPLRLSERLALRAHLAVCAGCRNFGRQLDFMRAAARRFLR